MFQLKSKQQPKSKALNPANPFSSLNPNDFIPKRFGLHFSRPTIIMEYLVPSAGKLYHHKMRLEQKLKNNMPINEILSHLRARHAEYLSDVSDAQLTKLINALKNHSQKQKNEPVNNNNTNAMKTPLAPLQNQNSNQSSKLGKLEPLGIKKGFVESKKTTTFDDDVDDLLNDLGFPEEEKPKDKFPQQKKNTFTSNTNSTNFMSLQNKKIDYKDYQNYDLNKLTTEELQKEKEKMDDVFLVNQKKPGDKGYQYDIQEDFEEPYEDNEWDMDEEDDIV